MQAQPRIPLNKWRKCLVDNTANCPYVGKKEDGEWCCTIDKLDGITLFGCTPLHFIEHIDKGDS